MRELFVSYNIASILKDKGFNEQCLATYNTSKELILHNYILNNVEIKESLLRVFIAPLYQQVIDWLAKEHKIHTDILYERVTNSYYGHIFKVSNNNRVDFIGKDYYEALNKAIEEAYKLI